MDKLLKLEKYQLLHNSIYWCGMIGIFILGFLQQILMLQSHGTDRRNCFFSC